MWTVRLTPPLRAGTDGPVDAVAVEGTGQVIVGGTFAHADSAARTDLARFNTNGTLDTTFNPVLNGAVSGGRAAKPAPASS